MSLRDRCLAFYKKAGVDAMLRVGDPVQNLYDFVLAEIGRAASEKLAEADALVLYFADKEGREEFQRVILDEMPGMVSRAWP